MENFDRWRSASRKLAALAAFALPVLASPAAQAWVDPNTQATVRRLAHVVEMESSQALQIAQQYAWGGDYNEQSELSNLRNLVGSAQYFDSSVERYWDDLSQTYGDFYRVSQDFEAAQNGLNSLRAAGQVQYQIQQADEAIDQLRDLYNGQGNGNGGGGVIVVPGGGPSGGPVGNIGVLAQEIDSEAQNLANSAAQEAQWDARKTQAVQDARALAQAASQLDNDARGWGGNVGFDVQQVNNAYNRVRISVPRSNFSVNVLRPFNHLGQLIYQLSSGQ